jgi:hypothetical protein
VTPEALRLRGECAESAAFFSQCLPDGKKREPSAIGNPLPILLYGKDISVNRKNTKLIFQSSPIFFIFIKMAVRAAWVIPEMRWAWPMERTFLSIEKIQN